MPDTAERVAPPRAGPSGRSDRWASGWWTPVGLALLTVVLRLPAFLSARHLVFDDGTYGVSAVDMRHGLAPYRGVFSAQGPLHFPLLYAGDLLGLRTLDGPRVAPMLAGIAATLAAWAIARRLADPVSGVVAGVLLATSGSMIWTTGQITGDGIAAAIALGAVWAAVAYRDDPRLVRALLAGVLMGAALAVKPLVLPAAIPVGWWLWSRRRADHVAGAVGAAIALWLAAAIPWGLDRVWRQSVLYNSGAGPRYAKAAQLRKLASTLADRDVLVVAALVVALVLAVVAARRHPDQGPGAEEAGARRDDIVVLAVWAAVTALVLVVEPALYRNHLATIVPPLALLAAVTVRSRRVLAVVLILLVPWSAVKLHDILRPAPYRGDAAALMYELHKLPDDAQVISDEPGFVYRAGLRTPALMNDASVKRIDQHLLTTASVARAAADARVCAVVVWSDRFGRDLPGLPAALGRAGLIRGDTYPGHRALWLRRSAYCESASGNRPS